MKNPFFRGKDERQVETPKINTTPQLRHEIIVCKIADLLGIYQPYTSCLHYVMLREGGGNSYQIGDLRMELWNPHLEWDWFHSLTMRIVYCGRSIEFPVEYEDFQRTLDDFSERFLVPCVDALKALNP